MFGIAETMYAQQQGEEAPMRYPATVGNDAEVMAIDVNDSYPITIYHKLDSIVNGFSKINSFGDSYGNETEVVNMSLMVWAWRSKVLRPAYWLENFLKDSMPVSSKSPNIQITNYRVGNSTFDKVALIGREYSAVDVNYPDLMVFEMKYRIESTYRKGCFVINNGC